jgi:hypothetical protein
MSPVSAAILVVLLLVVLRGPRRWAVLGLMAGVFSLTQGHAVEIFGLSIWPIRFLEAAALARVLLRKELVWSRMTRIDWTLLLLYNYSGLVWVLRSSNVTPHMFASALDPTVCYLALRALVRSLDDIRWFLNAFVVLLIPFTALVIVERVTGQPAFGMVGATGLLLLRNGVPRCMGTFRHAILLGSVAAAFLALYIGLSLSASRRRTAALGGALCLVLVWLSNSGGPLISAGAALTGWALWMVRDRMFLTRRTLVAVVLLLLVFMKAPIWYLPAKVSGLIGGGGYHRSMLMDRAWQDMDRWWLVGMDMKDTIGWIPYYDEYIGGADITNQFIALALRGGLPAIIIFIVLLTFMFKGLGRALAVARASGSRQDEIVLWGLGVMVAVHVTSWLSIAYFDQSWAVWLMHAAAVSAAVRGAEAQAAEGTAEERTRVPFAASRRRPELVYRPVSTRSVQW